MLPNEDNNKGEMKDVMQLLGKKKEREPVSNYFTKEEAFNFFES